MGLFRYIDRWQGSIRDLWNREDRTDRLMALLEQRDRDLENWLSAPVSRVSLGKSAATSIANNTITALPFDVEAYDTAELHSTTTDTSRIVVPAGLAGLWTYGYSVDFAPNATGVRLAYIARNGSLTRYAFSEAPGTAGVNTSFTGTVDLNMAAGDYTEMFVYQNSGGALNVGVNAHFYGTFRSVSP